ncbi:MAG TPA: histidine phosphatase family protein [Kofleriaceae bacterium]|nr:histidine phosphatase family protein [Kofleriaceae bacterium]
MATLYLIRHGQASYGEEDYDRLSSRGREQATALGKHLANLGLNALYSGPLVRQRQTAEAAAEAAAEAGQPLPASEVVPELAEYQAFEMLKHMIPRLVAEDPRFAALPSTRTPRLLDEAFHAVLGRWSRDEWTTDDVERIGPFVERIRAGLDRLLRSAGSGARLACVTSAGPIGVAVGLLFGASAERMVRTSVVIRNASITELRFRSQGFDWQPEQLSLITFNATYHLAAELHTER